ncbi:MAG: multicopper oxidase domain-containing protein [Deltaproteobacteria bacterium]|nr:multicopper oxidase domain-containing protein [Deltaproteobacteria bacterium]
MRTPRVLALVIFVVLLGAAVVVLAPTWLPQPLQAYRYSWFGEPSYHAPPASKKVALEQTEPFCPDLHPDWRKSQVIDGVTIDESLACNPDNPWAVAAFVKGTNNVSMETLMKSGLAPDAVVMGEDTDGDGDPDVITIKLEVVELNGHSPDMAEPFPTFFIAPGIQPGLWVFAPKVHGMATKNADSLEANDLLRAPSPVIRVEQGDTVRIVLENTHYFPHTIHFHGVDHPYAHHENQGNDGAPETSELPVMPGESRTYEFSQFDTPSFHTGHGEVMPGKSRTFALAPRQPGTMFYHCHVQPQHHIHMGLQGMFVVEENRPNNWVQTLNIGAGQVRHPSVAVREQYAQEYDLHFQDIDSTLNNIIQKTNDPRLIEKSMNREYNVTQRRANYFLLNGRSFPYTFRESLVVVEPDQHIKLRVLSGGEEGLSLHSHGHKMTITHYDGVAANPAAQITRDVFWLSTAQRLDLDLNTTNDGLHSYGEGVWMLHDHKERAFTTDGMHPGGSVSAIVSRSYLDEHGWPKMHGVDWTPFFSPRYYKREIPVWATYDPTGIFGEAGARTPRWPRAVLLGFIVGALFGLCLVLGRALPRRGRGA